jgi:hypothetical protein
MVRAKYPQTMHFQFSPGLQNDDRRIQTLDELIGREIVVTEKMDGENTSMYSNHIHARSLDSRHHPSRDWVKAFWGEINYLIPEDWRICGENVYAKHSVGYENLETYFYGFSIWNEDNVALSWDETLQWFEELRIEPVPVLYRGPFDLEVLKKLADTVDPLKSEGFVARVTGAVHYDEFDLKFAKWVRKGHVQTNKHWMTEEVVPNGLKNF